MIRDLTIQISSGYGWYEILNGKIRLRTGNISETTVTKNPPPRIHIHSDGIAITGLPKDTIDWILAGIEHETHHDFGNNKLAEPKEKPINIAIRLG